MFDGGLPEVAEFASLSAAALVDAAGGWARTENAAAARKLAAMAEIFTRRTGLPAGERESWWLDPHAAVGAELGAAVNVSGALALHQTHRGVVLRDRLPKVAALFAAGMISDLLVRAIVWRTDLVTDAAAMAALDAALADQIRGWGALSVTKTEAAIDALVDQVDPGALRRARESAAHLTVEFGSPADAAGTTSMWARLYAPDAAVIQQRVDDMATSVCPEDPRTLPERRAAALKALADGAELACTCARPDCPGPTADHTPKNTVVYVIADHTSLHPSNPPDGPTDDPDDPTDDPADGPDDLAELTGDQTDGPDTPPASAGSSGLTLPCPGNPPPAYVFGGGVLPTALLGGIVDRARIREVHHPGQAPPEPRYTPSRQLAEFVRCRDLTCRFPGCDKPAPACDIDHSVPFPLGPTHPSNLKCLCRFHHLLKTFWTGRDGWRDRQLADGTIIWTSPTGHTYTTHPGSKHLYAALCAPTATLWTADPPTADTTAGDRGAMMPKRRQTRAQTTAQAIAAQRRLNDPYVAERNKPPPF